LIGIFTGKVFVTIGTRGHEGLIISLLEEFADHDLSWSFPLSLLFHYRIGKSKKYQGFPEPQRNYQEK